MNLSLRNDIGCTEAVLSENCGFDQFYSIADVMAEQANISFTNKIDDTQTSYWDFQYNGHKLTLHYNVQNGVSIFPRKMKDALSTDNEAVAELATVLINLQ